MLMMAIIRSPDKLMIVFGDDPDLHFGRIDYHDPSSLTSMGGWLVKRESVTD